MITRIAGEPLLEYQKHKVDGYPFLKASGGRRGAVRRLKADGIVSYDKHFERIPDITRLDP